MVHKFNPLDPLNSTFETIDEAILTIIDDDDDAAPTVNVLGVWNATITVTNCQGMLTKGTITFHNLFGDDSKLGYWTTMGEDIDPDDCSIFPVNITDASIEGMPSNLTEDEFSTIAGGDANDEIIMFTDNEIRVDINHGIGSTTHLVMKREDAALPVDGGGGGGGSGVVGGGGGGGCTAGTTGNVDPVLLFILLASGVGLLQRRRVGLVKSVL